MDEQIHVLHVDDEPGFADVTAEFVERADEQLTVEATTSPGKLLDAIHETDYECIVSDYDLPMQDGIALLEAVRGEFPKLPFILFTRHERADVLSEALSAGVTDYLQKRGDTEQYELLAHKIRDAVWRYRVESALESDQKSVEAAIGTDSQRNRAFGGRKVQTDELTQRISHGSERLVKSTTSNSRTDQGVTERKAVTNTSGWDGTQARQLLEALSKTLPSYIFIYDRDGVYREILLGARQGTTEHSKSELLGERVEAVFEEKTAQTLQDTIERVLSTGKSETLEYGLGGGDDETWYNANVARLPGGYDGDPAVVLVAHDITERKRRARELERQNERLERFASIVSHDLRNPLNVARGQLELARDGTDQRLEQVATAIERMETLIDDLLTMARQGTEGTDRKELSVAAVARRAVNTVSTGQTNVRLETEREICADRGRLQQLIENLVRNAVEHTGSDVTVTIGDLQDRTGFYVADDGPGIPTEERDRVFETGYSTSEQGTGYGLAIVTEIVEAHGWSIRVTESADGGARFEIRIT